MHFMVFRLSFLCTLTIVWALPRSGDPPPPNKKCTPPQLNVYNREWCVVQQAMNTAIEKASEAGSYPGDGVLNSAIAAYYYAFIDREKSDKTKWKTWAYSMHNVSTDALEPSCDNSIAECKTDTPLKVEIVQGGYIRFTFCDAWLDDSKFAPVADPTKLADPTPSGSAWDVKCNPKLLRAICGGNHLGDFFAKGLKFNALLEILLTLPGYPRPQYNPSSKALTIPDALDYNRGSFKSPQFCAKYPKQICPATEARNNVVNVLYYVSGVYWSDVCGFTRIVIPPDTSDAEGGMVTCTMTEVVTIDTWNNKDKETCQAKCAVGCNHRDDSWYCICPQNKDGWKLGHS